MNSHSIDADEGDDELLAETPLAWVHPATDEDAAYVMAQAIDDPDGRSGWAWLRLREGTLALVVFPRGDTYEHMSGKDVAPFGK